MEALRALRPWVGPGRIDRLTVSVDGAPATDVTVLNTIRASDVLDVTLVRGAGARIRQNGDVVAGDALVVRIRRAVADR
jgi:hypothetical protein